MKALQKDTFREIKKTYKRFISILLMAMLGIGVFIGINVSGSNMRANLENYFSKYNMFDFKIYSTLGLTDEDVNSVKNLDGIESVCGAYEKDVIIELSEKEYVVSVLEYNKQINNLELLSGKFPENNKECVVEENLFNEHNLSVNSKISLNEHNDENEENVFINSELEIVGVVKSPLYISKERGTSKLGSGKVEYYMYASSENINSDIYTSMYVKIDNKNVELDKIKQEIENISNDRKDIRYKNLIGEATSEINEAEEKLNNEEQDAREKLETAEIDLKNAENKILQSEKELKSNLNKVNSEFNKADIELANQEKVYEEKVKEANSSVKELESKLVTLKEQLLTIEKQISNLREKYNLADENVRVVLSEKIEELEAIKTQVAASITQLESVISNINNELSNGRKQLDNAKAKLTETKNSTYYKLNVGKEKLEQGKIDIEKGKKELSKNKEEFDIKIAEAKVELEDAKQKVKDIKYPKWYVLDRKEANYGYNSLVQESENIDNISKVFPIIFFAVATLMSLTSMTRMVDEQRTEIGTLKALGYKKYKIASKFVLYALLATLIGSAVGIVLGFNMIAEIIIDVCLESYYLPRIPVIYDWGITTLGILITAICIVGGAIYASYRKLKYVPAQLMRPKAPKPGKRVLLERVGFVWKRLTFTQKVTLRNIFRYKNRFLMAIFGICGATSLILVGFGTKDSVSKITPMQYEEIYHYQAMLGIKDDVKNQEMEKMINDILSKQEINEVLPINMQGVKIIDKDITKDVYLLVVDNSIDNFNEFIELRDRNNKQEYKLDDNSVILSERIAQVLNIKKGDNIIIRDEDGNENEVLVGEITENYISHYMYMSKSLYEQIYKSSINDNILLLKTDNIDKIQEKELGESLINDSRVSSLNFISDINTHIKSMDFVVVVLIILSALLAFLVLYNLSNINMNERIRELATLKVLGFYNNEVGSYVNREMTILSIIGIAFGLGFGYILNYFVLEAGAPEFLLFPKVIEPISYLYAILMVASFTIIVGIVTRFALKKVSMIESLKSVE